MSICIVCFLVFLLMQGKFGDKFIKTVKIFFNEMHLNQQKRVFSKGL